MDVRDGEGRHKAKRGELADHEHLATLRPVFLIYLVSNVIRKKNKDQRFVKVIHISHNAAEFMAQSEGQP